jgi:hypothetical protein
VVKLELHDKKDKQKAMKAVSALVGTNYNSSFFFSLLDFFFSVSW